MRATPIVLGIVVAIQVAACSFVEDGPEPLPVQDSETEPSSIREGDLVPENPQIDIVMHGSWGQYDNFSVSPTGVFTQRFTYGVPELTYQLSASEFDSLYQFFSGFRGFEEKYFGGCADGDTYNITVKNSFFEHAVAAYCIYNHPYLIDGSVEWRLNRLIGELLRLSSKTIQQSAPWVGLTATPSLDRLSYTFQDSVQIQYQFDNLTGVNRTVYIISEDVFSMSITGPSVYFSPNWSGSYCPQISENECSAHSIIIAPGESAMAKRKIAIADFLSGPPQSPISLRASFWLMTGRDFFPQGVVAFEISP